MDWIKAIGIINQTKWHDEMILFVHDCKHTDKAIIFEYYYLNNFFFIVYNFIDNVI